MAVGPGREQPFATAVELAPGRAIARRRGRVEAALRLVAGVSLAGVAIVAKQIALGLVAGGLIIWAIAGYRRSL